MKAADHFHVGIVVDDFGNGLDELADRSRAIAAGLEQYRASS